MTLRIGTEAGDLAGISWCKEEEEECTDGIPKQITSTSEWKTRDSTARRQYLCLVLTVSVALCCVGKRTYCEFIPHPVLNEKLTSFRAS